MTIASIDPATGRLLRTFAPLPEAEVAARLELAATAYARHRRTSFAERAARLYRVADFLDAERERLARIAVREMGKPIGAARAEVEKCAGGCRWYAEHAAALLADEPIVGARLPSTIVYLPLGPVLAVMPWNFPFWQVVRFAAPALMAGNVALLKHASNVPQCALALEDLFLRAGFEAGVFQVLLIGGAAAAAVVADPRVAAVTLTGSEGAGAAIAAAAGRHLKKCVLELGGSDPFIVMPSADVAAAAATGVTARALNNGQSCINAKRFLVHDAVYDRFVTLLVDGLSRLRVGDPAAEDTELGPLATEAARSELERQVEASVVAGARVLLGGRSRPGDGWFYEATVLADIPPQAPVAHEEVFGPVALVWRVHDLDEAIAVANATPFGLGSSVWTADPVERERCIREIEAGMTFVNGMVASDPRLPFGGVKRSGFGRELGALGIREFTNVKTIVESDNDALCAPGSESGDASRRRAT
ncbi:MAG: NADP-dependent succinic semialdehyde dehydrogenase [Polyangiaceae bacterium UTPRO1]|jgi:succinate-semialdehyde dehydrogenase/glutarate-semialdehyde dehydrogenase|nr:NAD-dependent succinate-semialdehyde dehydrogenase [Myxococcales bacterium]OQY69395.1 MAG: NADP-dependent succinic semialdehyde dehydrogenase [Polyangiaceae bacterium UTPRO1]